MSKTNVMGLLDQKNTKSKDSHTDAISGLEAAGVQGVEPNKIFKTPVTVGKSVGHYIFLVPVNPRRLFTHGNEKELFPFVDGGVQELVINGYQTELKTEDLWESIRCVFAELTTWGGLM